MARWLVHLLVWLIDRYYFMASVRVVRLYEPYSYTTATCHDKKRVCNGCGSSKAKFDFIPDTVWFLAIRRACDIHDWMYHYGKTLEDKEEADRVFLNNMLRLIEAQSNRLMKPLRRRRALKYYEAVTAFGGPCFWDGKI